MADRRSLIFYVLVLLWLALGILCMNVSPRVWWPIGFGAFSTPAPLILNLLFLAYWLFRRSWAALLPVLVLVLGWDYYQRGLAVHLGESPVAETANHFQVLSYNARVFNNYQHLRDPDLRSSREQIDWIARHPADVVLIQEFYNKKDSEVFNTSEKIKAAQGRELALSLSWKNRQGEQFGLAIFSRYPIVQQGKIPFEPLNFNHCMFADIQINKDTLRVYNVHLESMSIDDEAIAGTLRGEHVRSQWKDAARRFRKGFLKRSEQVDFLLAHMAASPYPVLIGGDFNDTPWTYTYEQFSKGLSNGFQGAGTGFGFTYNGKIPFLRIDHQFYSNQLQAHQFTVHEEVPYTDHFPTSGVYSFPD